VSRKHRKQTSKKPPPAEIVPLVSYPSGEEDDDTQQSAPRIHGPFLPSWNAPATSHNAPSDPTTGRTEDRLKAATDSASDGLKVESEEMSDRKSEKQEAEINNLKKLHKKFQQRTQNKRRLPAANDAGADGGESSADHPHASRVSDHPETSAGLDVAEDEMAAERTDDGAASVQTGRSNEGETVAERQPATSRLDEAGVDVEDIDKQLDLALTRHKVRGDVFVTRDAAYCDWLSHNVEVRARVVVIAPLSQKPTSEALRYGTHCKGPHSITCTMHTHAFIGKNYIPYLYLPSRSWFAFYHPRRDGRLS